MRQHNIHGYIYRMSEVWYPHMDISMDISIDIHIHGKPATTPAHKTTLYTMGPTRGFHSSAGNHSASGPTHQQTSYMSSAATHPRQTPEPNRANESHRRVSKPDRKTVVPNYSAFGIYWNPSLTHHLCNSLSNAPPNSNETPQEQQGHPAHMTSPQIRQAPIKQCPMGVC